MAVRWLSTGKQMCLFFARQETRSGRRQVVMSLRANAPACRCPASCCRLVQRSAISPFALARSAGGTRRSAVYPRVDPTSNALNRHGDAAHASRSLATRKAISSIDHPLLPSIPQHPREKSPIANHSSVIRQASLQRRARVMIAPHV